MEENGIENATSQILCIVKVLGSCQRNRCEKILPMLAYPMKNQANFNWAKQFLPSARHHFSRPCNLTAVNSRLTSFDTCIMLLKSIHSNMYAHFYDSYDVMFKIIKFSDNWL